MLQHDAPGGASNPELTRIIRSLCQVQQCDSHVHLHAVPCATDTWQTLSLCCTQDTGVRIVYDMLLPAG